ncbi:MAG: efflux RND transporter periplasmic adaptor subunit [Desulfovibrionaceae bacterium]|nr:efflux RND transporter periplasmic adaptor subunit [Desulfovibrionaceae bacterium]
MTFPALEKPVYLLCLLLTLPLLSACSDAEEQKLPPPGVVITTLEPQNVPLIGKFVGQTAGFREVEVRAQVSGILLKKDYVEGDIVEKNQLLFQIDPAPYQAALNQAKGNLAQAEARLYQTKLDHDRFLRLYNEAAVSRKERDDAIAAYRAARGDVEAARALVENAEINLGYTTVLAPISGAASEENFSEGNLVSVGQVLTKMVQIDPLYVNFSIPSADALHYADMMKRGMLEPPANNQFDVDIELSDGSLHSGKGVVNFFDPRVDPATSSIKARAQLVNDAKNILPGQFARVYMRGYMLKDVLIVPQRAVLHTQNGPVLYVLDENNHVQMAPFEQEMSLGPDYILKKGAKAGDRIVVDGIQKVQPGGPVTILSESGSSNSTEPKSN